MAGWLDLNILKGLNFFKPKQTGENYEKVTLLLRSFTFDN